MSKLGWYLKQAVPLTYRSRYADETGAKFAVWKMWMGRCYRVEVVDV